MGTVSHLKCKIEEYSVFVLFFICKGECDQVDAWVPSKRFDLLAGHEDRTES